VLRVRAPTINPISVHGAINQAALPGIYRHCRINLWTKAGAVRKANVFFRRRAKMWFTIGPTVRAAPVGGDGALLNQHDILAPATSRCLFPSVDGADMVSEQG
jgi:hypothetical protein